MGSWFVLELGTNRRRFYFALDNNRSIPVQCRHPYPPGPQYSDSRITAWLWGRRGWATRRQLSDASDTARCSLCSTTTLPSCALTEAAAGHSGRHD